MTSSSGIIYSKKINETDDSNLGSSIDTRSSFENTIDLIDLNSSFMSIIKLLALNKKHVTVDERQKWNN